MKQQTSALLILGAFVLGAILTFNSHSALADAQKDPDMLLGNALETWKGDLDGIKERGFLRIAMAHNPIYLAYDGEKRIGIAAEIERELQAHLKKTLKTPITVMLMPLARDQILPAVVEGRADVAAANLTITEERSEIVAFTDPTRKDVAELVVSGPAAGDITTLEDLVEVGLHLRPSSSYFGHLDALNAERKAGGKKPIPVVEADETLEDYDLLEMVQAGIIPAIVVDDHKARLWVQVFDRISLHEDLVIHSGGQIAWAVRKDAPKLLSAMNAFVAKIRKGTLLGNILDKRYLKSADWIERVDSNEARERMKKVLGFVRDYAGQYDFDWIMILAQGYQESRLDQSKRSDKGAVGVMQVLPTTAKDKNVGIADITTAENNVHAGVKYLRFLRNRYFSDPEIAHLDQMLFAFAAYNAGPANISKARKRAAKMGLDPNVWFDNTETAAGRVISREPVTYVRNIYKYSVAYTLATDLLDARGKAVLSK